MKLEAAEAFKAFKAFKAVAENDSGKRIHEMMMDNMWELSMGEVRYFHEVEGIKLNTTTPSIPRRLKWRSRMHHRGTYQRGVYDASRLWPANVSVGGSFEHGDTYLQ